MPAVELALFRLESRSASCARTRVRLDALLVGLHLSRGRRDLRGDLQLLVLEYWVCAWLYCSLHPRQVGVGGTGADRIADVQLRRPARILVLKQVAEHIVEAPCELPKDVAGTRSERARARAGAVCRPAPAGRSSIGLDIGQRLVA